MVANLHKFHEAPMNRRLRTFIGTCLMIVYVIVYALVAIALTQSRVLELPHLVQTLIYLILGLIWVVPLIPLLSWMSKKDAETA
jgi:predicted membrane channel-forming protein YqfA (hemolysin III family)